MMDNGYDDKLEQHIRFVAKHYKEGSLDADKAWENFASGRKVSRRIPLMRYLLQAAAVVLLLIGIGTFYVWEQSRPDWVAISTVAGQKKDIYLPDSTLISLAGDSWIRYDVKNYGKDRRVVEMKGKAFFQVKRNETRPFFVEADLAEIRVLGTSFQVETPRNSVEVNVETGKVSFTAGKEKEQVILTAGMSASYSMEKKGITVLTEEDANYLSWKTGLLRFTDAPINKVIEDLDNYYQVKITNKITKPDAKLTASFNNMPLDEVLMVINQTLDIRLVPEAGE
ncbi:FecR family protein [Parabacteroides chinchillae]|uniref:FecR family protein n=1 Tax=Parabacteroides chinchillae TaxID=871327 RepID=A0A8G2BZ05_9BACT|nr:FecR domain-containing protein [Parabacteroides chinchillae]SEG26699.1 FecR family protein [Parabacteroides chinchillae]